MSPRQARTGRRAAERKAKKAEIRRLKTEAVEIGFVPQIAPIPAAPARHSNESDGHVGFVSQTPVTTPPAEPRPVHPISEARRAANRLNALHSTGPSTSQGKLASSLNSLKHGLASGELLIAGEDRAAFEALRHDLLEEHQPANQTEALLVNELAQSYWLEQRAIRLQNGCFTANGVDEKRLSLFLRYATTYNRAFHKAVTALLKLQKERSRTGNGFVSQQREFVRKNRPSIHPNDGFVSQTHMFGNQTEPIPPKLIAVEAA